jgi:hypothetical protein
MSQIFQFFFALSVRGVGVALQSGSVDLKVDAHIKSGPISGASVRKGLEIWRGGGVSCILAT